MIESKKLQCGVFVFTGLDHRLSVMVVSHFTGTTGLKRHGIAKCIDKPPQSLHVNEVNAQKARHWRGCDYNTSTRGNAITHPDGGN